MTGGLRFDEGNVVCNHDGRLYRITRRDIQVTLQMTELRSDGSAPCSLIISEAWHDPVFDQFFRLLPEGNQDEPR